MGVKGSAKPVHVGRDGERELCLRVSLERWEGSRELEPMDVPPGRAAFGNGMPEAFISRHLL